MAKRTETKPCRQCGKPFVPWKQTAEFCSRQCSWASRTKRKPCVCRGCGKTFTPKKRNTAGLYCTRECAFESRRQGKERCVACGVGVAINDGYCYRCDDKRPRLTVGQCPECGMLVPSNKVKRFCSESCKEAKRKKDQYKPKPKLLLVCVVCAKSFFGPKPKSGKGGPYCGKKCADKAWDRTEAGRLRHNLKQRERKAIVRAGDDINPYTVFERDGWRCGLCGKRVRRDVAWPHPESAVLDHIVPVCKGGQHVWSNVQCAHNRCNSERREVGPAQMRLF